MTQPDFEAGWALPSESSAYLSVPHTPLVSRLRSAVAWRPSGFPPNRGRKRKPLTTHLISAPRGSTSCVCTLWFQRGRTHVRDRGRQGGEGRCECVRTEQASLKGKECCWLTVAEGRVMEPQEIREGYLVKKVRTPRRERTQKTNKITDFVIVWSQISIISTFTFCTSIRCHQSAGQCK